MSPRGRLLDDDDRHRRRRTRTEKVLEGGPLRRVDGKSPADLDRDPLGRIRAAEARDRRKPLRRVAVALGRVRGRRDRPQGPSVPEVVGVGLPSIGRPAAPGLRELPRQTAVLRRRSDLGWRGSVGGRARGELSRRALVHGQRHRVRRSADRADDRLLRTDLARPRVASGVGRDRCASSSVTVTGPSHRFTLIPPRSPWARRRASSPPPRRATDGSAASSRSLSP